MAYLWLRRNHPEALFSKANPTATRLFTDPFAFCWALVEQGDKIAARLVLASSYDGSRGGVPGLAHLLGQAACIQDDRGKTVAHAKTKESGFRLCVKQTKPPGGKFPSYSVRAGRDEAPLEPLLDRLSAEDLEAIRPLEEVLMQTPEEEQWLCLERCIAPSIVAEIRGEQRAA